MIKNDKSNLNDTYSAQVICRLLLRGLALILIFFAQLGLMQWPLLIFSGFLLCLSRPREGGTRARAQSLMTCLLLALLPQVWFSWQFPREALFLTGSILASFCYVLYAVFCIFELCAYFRTIDTASAVKSAMFSLGLFALVAIFIFFMQLRVLFGDYAESGLNYYTQSRPAGVFMFFTVAMLNALLGLQYFVLAYRLLGKIKLESIIND